MAVDERDDDVTPDEICHRCNRKQQRKAWRPKCAAPRLGYAHNLKVTHYYSCLGHQNEVVFGLRQGPWFQSRMTAIYLCVSFQLFLLAPCIWINYVRWSLRCRLYNGEVSFVFIQSAAAAGAALCGALLLLLLQQQCCAASCCCSSSCAGWPNLLLVHWIWSQCFLSLHSIAIFFSVPIGSTVPHLRPRFSYVMLGNYGHTRSKCGRQPTAAKPLLFSFWRRGIDVSNIVMWYKTWCIYSSYC